jgi:PelA/Pel-15E family pectate lyase
MHAIFLYLILLLPSQLNAQSNNKLENDITSVMMRATKFFADSVSENGGFVSHYLPDFSRRWGEMEAYPSMVWTQNPGTVSMGNIFLDAYFATHNEYYYTQAKKAADALVWGQLPCGGWNYFINFAGQNSTLQWYNTIGKNGWRLEEFQHYYGNATFDDETTSDAAFFLLRFYLTKLDPAYKTPVEKVISLVLKSQYPIGGWPQRYPLRHDFNKSGHPDYTSFYTFNDNVIWQNIKFLITCYATLNYHDKFYEGGDSELLDAVRRGMNFILLAQQPKPFAGWGQQYTMDLAPAGARTYEPKSLDPQYTAGNILILIKCYELTGDRRYIERIPDAIDWLKSTELKDTNKKGVYIYAKFVDPETGRPLYTHRIGSNVISGHYYVDSDSNNTVAHYRNFRMIDLGGVENYYNKILSEKPDSVTFGSPLIPGNNSANSLIKRYDEVTDYLKLTDIYGFNFEINKNLVEKIISSLDKEGRWLVKGMQTSNPYIGEPKEDDPNTKKYMTTYVGDKYDTSPYRDKSDQEYISTGVYTFNMRVLINYLNEIKNGTEGKYKN